MIDGLFLIALGILCQIEALIVAFGLGWIIGMKMQQ